MECLVITGPVVAQVREDQMAFQCDAVNTLLPSSKKYLESAHVPWQR